MKKTRSALEILDRKNGDDIELKRMIAEELINARVAQAIYDLRTQASLTQRELAKLVGTTQPVIARLEDADYQGRSLTMLIRIASALDKQLDIRFVSLSADKARSAMGRRSA